jgi:hypothetical protein
MESWYLQGYSPCLCQLRTDGLAPTSKYWTYRSHVGDMGPVSLVVGRQQKVCFAPTAILVGSGEKLGSDPRIDQSMCYWLCQEPFFSRVVALLNSVDDSWKVIMYCDYQQKAYTGHTWTGVGSIHVMLIGFSPTGCTSIRITVTLGYEYRLFAAVIT